MRVIWRKKWGFQLTSYPYKPTDNEGEPKETDKDLYKIAILDNGGDLWWVSDEAYDSEPDLREVGEAAWKDFLDDYSKNHALFPNGDLVQVQPPIELVSEEPEVNQESLKDKIKSTKKKKD